MMRTSHTTIVGGLAKPTTVFQIQPQLEEKAPYQEKKFEEATEIFDECITYLITYIDNTENNKSRLESSIQSANDTLSDNKELPADITENIQHAKQLKINLINTIQIASDKIKSAEILKENLASIASLLTEDFYTNPNASMESKLFQAFLAIQKHRGILREALPKNKADLITFIDKIINYYVEKPTQFAKKYLAPIEEYLCHTDPNHSDPKKVNLATRFKSHLLEIKSALSEDFYRNPKAPMINAFFQLFIAMKEHQAILDNMLPESSRGLIGDSVTNLIQKPLELAGSLYSGGLGKTFEDLKKSMTLEHPKEASIAETAFKKMHADEAKKTIFPALIASLDRYIQSKESKKDTFTQDKVLVATQLKKLLNQIQESQTRNDSKHSASNDDLVYRQIHEIIKAHQAHKKLTSETLLITTKKAFGETVGGVINSTVSNLLTWCGEYFYAGELGKELEAAIQIIENQLPGAIEIAKLTASDSPTENVATTGTPKTPTK